MPFDVRVNRGEGYGDTKPVPTRDQQDHLKLSEDVIKSYKASNPDKPVIFRRGDLADAEPAVPGWRMAVDDLFG
jgi:hypothetical protein